MNGDLLLNRQTTRKWSFYTTSKNDRPISWRRLNISWPYHKQMSISKSPLIDRSHIKQCEHQWRLKQWTTRKVTERAEIIITDVVATDRRSGKWISFLRCLFCPVNFTRTEKCYGYKTQHSLDWCVDNNKLFQKMNNCFHNFTCSCSWNSCCCCSCMPTSYEL